MNLTQHFTTPAFAKGLAEYGIAVETPFGIDDQLEIFAIGKFGDCISLLDGTLYTTIRKYLNPAYPLTQVLAWLPEKIEIEDDWYWIDFGLTLMIAYKNETKGYLAEWVSIENTILQGLSEGWLTKEEIIKNAGV